MSSRDPQDPSELDQLRARIRELELRAQVCDELERRVAETERRLREAERVASIGHWELDLRSYELFWSDEIYTMIGLEQGSIEPDYDTFLERIHPEDREWVDRAYRESVEHRSRYDIVHRVVLPDGTVKHIHERCVTVYDDAGDPLRSLGTAQDISERIRTERELARVRRLESLGLLAGGIAHDFNNFLTLTLGGIDVARHHLREGGDPKVIDGLLATAEHGCIRGRRLTQQLLTFAKGGAPTKAVADLRQIVRETVEFVVSGSELEYEFDFPDELWPASVDADQLSQVVENLVINARQATEGTGRLSVRLAEVELPAAAPGSESLPSGPYLRLEVIDDGPGISADIVRRIFDPFFTTKRGGSGLGLALVQSIVRAHGGAVEVDSQPKQGTRFSILLPAEPSAAIEPAANGADRVPRGGSALLMDDDAAIRLLTRTMLEQSSYSVVLAERGETAVARYRERLEAGERFDVVLLDLAITGGMGGREAAAAILELDPEARVIIVSGYDAELDLDSRSLEIAAILPKPYSVEQLREALAKAG